MGPSRSGWKLGRAGSLLDLIVRRRPIFLSQFGFEATGRGFESLRARQVNSFTSVGIDPDVRFLGRTRVGLVGVRHFRGTARGAELRTSRQAMVPFQSLTRTQSLP